MVTTQAATAYQTFMIDLSVSWNTSFPAYKALSLGPSQHYSPSAISADGKKWFTLAAGVGHVYDLDTNKWSKIFTNKAMEKLWGRGAATDPTTGLVYIPFAYPNSDGTFSMLKVNLTDGTYTSDNSTQTLPQQNQYAVAWSAPLRSLVYVIDGGVYTYNSTDGWKNYITLPNGAPSHGSCLVAANRGLQLVLFGGFSTTSNTPLSDIYILDVVASRWRKGASAPASDRRQSPACGISNDYFIAWGGDIASHSDVVAPANQIVIYDLRTHTWTTEYNASPRRIPDGYSPFLPGDDSQVGIGELPSKVAIISGAIAGGLIAILTVGCVLMYRRRSKRFIAIAASPPPCNPTFPPPCHTKDITCNQDKTTRGNTSEQTSTPSTYAQQQYRPVVTYLVSSSYIDSKALYVLGGRPRGEINSNQTFMIDLSKSWNTNETVYQKLKDFPHNITARPSALSKDGRHWFVLTSTGGYIYNLEASAWGQIFRINYNLAPVQTAAVTDPDTGLIYIPFGFEGPGNVWSMLIVNLTDHSTTNDGRNQSFPPQQSLDFYSVAWTYEGSQIVMFAGRPDIYFPDTLSDIYILDVATLTWRQGVSAPKMDGRRSAACAISNEQLVVWGGETAVNKNAFVPDHTVIVYDLKTDTWKTNYTAPTLTPTSPTIPTASADKSPIPIIVGVIAAVLVIIIVMGGYIFVARKRSQSGDAHKKGNGQKTNEDLKKENGQKTNEDFKKESLDRPNGVSYQQLPASPQGDTHHRFSGGSTTVVSSSDQDSEEGTLRRPGTVQQGLYGTQRSSLNPHTSDVGSPVNECISQEVFDSLIDMRDPHALLESCKMPLDDDKQPTSAKAL
ncbi:hypothetical protein BGZ65_012854 [Modicella reniformis]|uniref:Galactose oxidase n=1 Tax=Modicella reniformis TaxID=1440133 RepID=A0A9P6IMD3_9FUNG|nr:hypothetical protein BGZ65_012854 [Modicella reniformis]